MGTARFKCSVAPSGRAAPPVKGRGMNNSGWGLCSVTSSTEEEIRKPLEREVGLDLRIERVSSLDDVGAAVTEKVRSALDGGGGNGLVGQAEESSTLVVEGVYQVGAAAMTKAWTANGEQGAAATYVTSWQVAEVATVALKCGSREQVLTARAGVARQKQAESPLQERMIGADNLNERTKLALPSGSEEKADSEVATARGSDAVTVVDSVWMEAVDSDGAAVNDSEAKVVSHLDGKVAADVDLMAAVSLYEAATIDLGNTGEVSAPDVVAAVDSAANERVNDGGVAPRALDCMAAADSGTTIPDPRLDVVTSGAIAVESVVFGTVDSDPEATVGLAKAIHSDSEHFGNSG